MTDNELNEVSNKAWNAVIDQMPKEFTGRDLLKIVIRFVVKIGKAVDLKPTDVCMMMYDRLDDDRPYIKVVNNFKSALMIVGTVALIIGLSCELWFNDKFSVKLCDVGGLCILAGWVLEFAVKVIDRWI